MELQEVSETAETEQVKKKKKKPKKEKVPREKVTRTGFLKVLQHLAICVSAVGLIIVITGSTVVVPGLNGNETYTLSASDEGRAYEDSVLFNTIFGNETQDVIRLVAIRELIETNGNYDPDKVIDITAFNNRKSLSFDKSDNVTAPYYLGDLIKWSKYGFDYANVSTDEASDSVNYLTGDMLINRYKSAEGKNIEEYADSYTAYEYLVENLEDASSDLYTDYMEYLKLNDYFDDLKSNIRYCVVMGTGSDQVIYTNLDSKALKPADIDKTFKGYGRYIKYDHDRMIYSTNTAITESTFNKLMADYEYTYPDDCTLYIAADMDLTAADSLQAGSRGFNNYLPYKTQLIGLVIACMILYLAILVLCTIREGRALTAEGVDFIRFTAFDDSPIELWLLLLVLLGFASFMAGSAYIKNPDILATISDMPYGLVICGIGVFVYDCLLMGLYYSLIRRIKGRHIWKYSLLNKLQKGSVKTYYSIYDNGDLYARSWAPLMCLAAVNILLVYAAVRSHGAMELLCLVVLAAADIYAGVFVYKQVKDRQEIINGMNRIVSGDFSYKADTATLHGDNAELAGCVNSIGDSIRNAVDQSLKDEKMKADLIANVSHDIRTPLTSIINYVDLIKREDISNDKVRSYIQVLDEKSQRLKTLTDDLIEASKVSSGNVELELIKVNLPEMVSQSLAEFNDRFEEKGLSCVIRSDKLTSPCMMADGKSLWRVMENLYGNIYKYSMEHTRVFIDIFNGTKDGKTYIVLQIRNMSKTPLPENISELTERFVRADESRTSEGSGLGLSIAKSLTELMGGTFELAADGDLFKVELSFESVE